jgi:hypothetical protein
MSDAAWPETVSSEPEQSDYREVLTPNLGTFKLDIGTPVSWQRSTLDSAAIRASFLFYTNAERDDFWTWWRETLKGGVKPFTWTNPAYGTPARYIFGEPPQFTAIGPSQWRLDVELVRIK